MSHPWTFIKQAYSYAGPVLMLLYPLYASVMTLESSKTGDDDRSKVKKERDDNQWLAYWILHFFLYGSFFLGGSLAMGHLWTFIMLPRSIARSALMLLYPLYASVMTIESSKTGDDDRSKVKKERDDDQWILYIFLYGSFFLGGSLAMSHLWTFLTLPRSIVRSALMLLYPLYPSAKTIEKSKKASAKKEEKSKADNKQWLAYWILFSLLTLLEMLLERLLERIPIWYDVKLILIAWLVLPPFNGAAFLYDAFVGKPLRKRRSKPSSPNGKSSKK